MKLQVLQQKAKFLEAWWLQGAPFFFLGTAATLWCLLMGTSMCCTSQKKHMRAWGSGHRNTSDTVATNATSLVQHEWISDPTIIPSLMSSRQGFEDRQDEGLEVSKNLSNKLQLHHYITTPQKSYNRKGLTGGFPTSLGKNQPGGSAPTCPCPCTTTSCGFPCG